MNLFKFGKVVVHFMYKNNFIETSALVKEDDTTLNVLGRTIKKKTSHAFIDSNGKKHYFINGQSTSTSMPYKHYVDKAEFDELDREAVHATLKTNLLKSMASIAQQNMFVAVMILLAGVGVGYVLGTEYGGDTFNNQKYDQHYYPDEPQNNGTIVISTIKPLSIELPSINIPEVSSWTKLMTA